MKKISITISCLLLIIVAYPSHAGNYHWYKGNTHCHTIMSDGKNTPAEVIAAYHAQGYNFLAITDHNLLLNTDTVKKPAAMRKDFLLIPGEEASDRVAVHTTAFGISKYVPISTDQRIANNAASDTNEGNSGVKRKHVLTVTEMIQLHVDGTLLAGGIPFINHPNFSKGVKISDILPVKNLHHMEVYNGHPLVANWGKEGHIAVEAKWDSLLTHGMVMYGIASDDMHKLVTNDENEAGMFRGWIMVRSPELSIAALHKAIASGNFYATNSVILKRCDMSLKKCLIEINTGATEKEVAQSQGIPRIDKDGKEGFSIEFIGFGGKILSFVEGARAVYQPKKGDGYVRARITRCVKTNRGYEKLFAWVQPVFMY